MGIRKEHFGIGVGGVFGIGIILLWIAAIVGYFANIWQVAVMAFANGQIGTLFVVKIVGIFFLPLGAILGWWGYP